MNNPCKVCVGKIFHFSIRSLTLNDSVSSVNIEIPQLPKCLGTLIVIIQNLNFLTTLLFLNVKKIASGTANGADPDQTAPKEQSDQGLHSLHINF